jgi:hypothetical protein
MRGGDCDRLWEVDAYRAGLLGAKDVEAFERHLRTCTACRRRVESDERLRDLANALPRREPSPLTLRRVRSRMLRGVAGADVPRARVLAWRGAVAAALVMAIGAAAWSLRARPTARVVPAAAVASAESASAPAPASSGELLAGVVTSAADARWSQTRRGPLEEIRLASGAVHVVARPQAVGERFLIELPDGEIEVRGTTFDVDVEGGATRRVYVAEGIVELRLNGQSAIRLGPSESWPASVSSSPSQAPPGGQRGPSHAPSARRVAQGDDSALEYAEAVQRLRDGLYDDAASRFRAFVVAHPGVAEAEDASFLEAVALARAGRTEAAALAGEHHLARFPRSFHAKEAAILVARAASQRHDCDKARRAVAPWSSVDAAGGGDVQAALGSCVGDASPQSAASGR